MTRRDPPPGLDALFALFVLDDYWHAHRAERTAVGELVHRAKDRGDAEAGAMLAERFAGLSGVVADLVGDRTALVAAVPPCPPPPGHVPTMLARALAAAGVGEWAPALLRRERPTPRVRDVAPEDRVALVAGAGYAASPQAAGVVVVLVDDVILTGTTLGHVAGLLRDAGAEQVIGAVAARTRRR